MKYQRYVFLAGLWFCCGGLSGFKQPLEDHFVSDATNIETSDTKNKHKSFKNSMTTQKSTHPILDLTLPDEPLQSSDPVPNSLNSVFKDNDLFVKPAPKQPGPLQLNGRWLMSQEPEAEKRKSVDGAGISINIRP